MGRRRSFDEDEVVRAAVGLFGGRSYDGVSIDDLVNHLGVHRNSLYKTFGSKRGLYLAGPESMLARRPEAVGLAAELGLDVVHPASGSSQLWTRGALRPLPTPR